MATLTVVVLNNVIRLPKELAKPKQKFSKGWRESQFIEQNSLLWALMGLFIGFTYSSVLVFIPIELNSMEAGIWGSVFFALFALMIIISRPLFGLGYGAAQPAFQALAVQSALIERVGVSTATYFLALDIAVGGGSVVLVIVANALGYQHLYQITAIVMIIALALYHFVIRKHSYIAE